MLDHTFDDDTGAAIAQELYLVIGKTLKDPIYDRLKALAGGCEGNGFQLGRELRTELVAVGWGAQDTGAMRVRPQPRRRPTPTQPAGGHATAHPCARARGPEGRAVS